MLSKIGSLFDAKARVAYTEQDIEQAVSQVKSLGKRANGRTDEVAMHDVTQILATMNRYSDSLPVQRVCSHAISNLAMQVVIARFIVQKGGFNAIRRAINTFVTDYKLCWLASSAVWNLARPPANRAVIGKHGALAMLQILKEHHQRDKVANTAIGALSNLSLMDDLKDLIAEPQNVELILAVLCHACNSQQISVMTSGSGLLANIAVSDEHAALLLEKNALQMMLPVLTWKSETDDTLFRNTCAALNNLVTAEGFLPAFLKSKGLETITNFLKTQENTDSFDGLLENCLASVDADPTVDSTSLHYACLHGQLPEFEHLLKEVRMDFDLNAEKDGRGLTCLDYALMNGHAEVAEYLSKLGAETHCQKLGEDAEDDNVSDEDKAKHEELEGAMQKGQTILRECKQDVFEAIDDSLSHFPTDLCKHLVGYQSNWDVLSAVDMISA